MSRKTFLIVLFLFLSACSSDNSDSVGENAVSNEQGASQKNIESNTEDLPDPNDSGFDLPIL